MGDEDRLRLALVKPPPKRAQSAPPWIIVTESNFRL